jgi:hypothetical protein
MMVDCFCLLCSIVGSTRKAGGQPWGLRRQATAEVCTTSLTLNNKQFCMNVVNTNALQWYQQSMCHHNRFIAMHWPAALIIFSKVLLPFCVSLSYYAACKDDRLELVITNMLYSILCLSLHMHTAANCTHYNRRAYSLVHLR